MAAGTATGAPAAEALPPRHASPIHIAARVTLREDGSPMAKASEAPTFNMKVVVQETGLKPDTLRAWERRYGLPNPQRTAGGHRLYSQREIDMLKWLIARQEEGLSISNAIELWQSMEADGRDPLLDYREPGAAAALAPPLQGGVIEESCAAWVDACLAFDEHRAQHVLAQAFALFPMETVCFEVLQKGLQAVGRGWYEGRVTVQQEHFASAQAVRQLEALLSAMNTAVRHGRLLLACPPEEQHTFGPLLLALLLRRRGWDIVYLGANVPLERLEASVRSIRPQLVILAAQTLITAATTLSVAQLLQTIDVPLAFGGAVFNQLPDARARIPGHFLGEDLAQAPERIKALLDDLPPSPTVAPQPLAMSTALDRFQEQRAFIEAYVHQEVQDEALTTAILANANEDLGNNIEAALQLGDLDLLWANMAWVQGLLVNFHYRMPEALMRHYLTTYRDGADRYLGEPGRLVVHWLSRLVA